MSAPVSAGCGIIRVMDSDDPEERIRELERRLAEDKGGPGERVLGPSGVPPGPPPATFLPPPGGLPPPPPPGMMPFPPPGVNRSGYGRLRRQIDRRRRVSAIWGVSVVPGILLVLVLVFHLYR